MGINRGRVWLGGIAGGVAWSAWSFFVGHNLQPQYKLADSLGQFLHVPRYPFFPGGWIALLFVQAILLAHLYVWVRPTLGPGPMTAFKVGAIVGFAAGLPENYAMATWSPISRALPLGWMLDAWGGAILATVVAAWVYRE